MFAVAVCMFGAAIAMVDPKLFDHILSTITTVISSIIILGIIGGVIYLIIQTRKIENKPCTHTVKRCQLSSRAYGYDGYTNSNIDTYCQQVQAIAIDSCEENRIEHVKHSQQSQLNVKHTTHDIYIGIRSCANVRVWDVSILREIEWKRFEAVCTGYLNIAGYVAQETNTGADGGVDIRVSKPGDEKFKGIVQCKAWNTYKVGIKPIRELFGIMAADRISTGILITSGDFTAEAEKFASGKITLVCGEKFINLIKKLSQSDQEWLLDVALEGDYRTPTCPHCDIKMTLREVAKGRNVGGKFWGCVRYPRCKQTLVYKKI